MSEHKSTGVAQANATLLTIEIYKQREKEFVDVCEAMLASLAEWRKHQFIDSTDYEQMVAAQSMLSSTVSKATGKPCNPADYDQNPGRR